VQENKAKENARIMDAFSGRANGLNKCPIFSGIESTNARCSLLTLPISGVSGTNKKDLKLSWRDSAEITPGRHSGRAICPDFVGLCGAFVSNTVLTVELDRRTAAGTTGYTTRHSRTHARMPRVLFH
jgi:hypothetical protein